jgi:hypothetical protein
MKKQLLKSALLAVALGGLMFNQAYAKGTLLSFSITADNSFEIYLSTDNSTAGTLLGSGTNWVMDYQGSSIELSPGQVYYIHVVAHNSAPSSLGNPAGFLGDFSLNGTNFQFANGTQSLSTNTTEWQTSATGWSAYGSPTSFGANSNSSTVWNSYNGGPISGISGSAQWIWTADGGASVVDNYFTATIQSIPEPSTIMLLGCGGLGMIGIARAKHRKTADVE